MLPQDLHTRRLLINRIRQWCVVVLIFETSIDPIITDELCDDDGEVFYCQVQWSSSSSEHSDQSPDGSSTKPLYPDGSSTLLSSMLDLSWSHAFTLWIMSRIFEERETAAFPCSRLK